MNDKTLELERQVAQLSAEVTQLRRVTMLGFAIMAIILLAGFINRDWVMTIIATSLILGAVAYVIYTFSSVLSRRAQRQRANGLVR